MLVFSRKVGEEIVLPNCGVTIGVVAVNGRRVRLGIAAPPEITVHRKEVWHRIRASNPLAPGQLASMVRQLADRWGIGWERPTASGGGPDWPEEVARRIAARTRGHVLEIAVELVDARLIVHGRSRSYYGKQLACAAALELAKTLDFAPFTQIELDIEVLRIP